MKRSMKGAMCLLWAGLWLGGCQTTAPSTQVTAMTSSRTAALEARQIVLALRHAAFTDEQILELGTDVRNAIARAGGANIRMGERTEALLAVEGRHLHVSSRRGGTRTYEINNDDLLKPGLAAKSPPADTP